MHSIKTPASLLLVSVFAVSVVSVVPVAARPGEENREVTTALRHTSEEAAQDSSSRVQSSDSGSDSQTSSENQVQGSTKHERGDVRERGSKLVAEERKGKRERSAEARKKSCEARQASLDKRVTNYSRHAEKHLATFDKIYDRVQTFQEEKKLDAANYNELVKLADAKRAEAEKAVATLKAVSVKVDCAGDPAAAVATVKAAVQDTRTALKDYRTAIKDVVSALNASAPDDAEEKTDGTTDGDATTGDTTTGGTTDNSTSTDNTTE